jgi:hypothetical protein
VLVAAVVDTAALVVQRQAVLVVVAAAVSTIHGQAQAQAILEVAAVVEVVHLIQI